nr:PPOX class F420-dependent oxidoreductase [Lentzea sp. NBRC 102530]
MTAPEPRPSVFTEAELDYLDGQRLGRLATVHPDGTLQANPVDFRHNPATDTIDIGGYGMARSRKYRNIADNGRAAFVVDDIASYEPWRVRCLDLRGRAEVIEEPTDSVIGSAIGLEGPIIRFHPSRIVSFGIEEADTEAHELTVNARTVA